MALGICASRNRSSIRDRSRPARFVRTEFTALSTGTDLGNFEGRSTEVPGAPGLSARSRVLQCRRSDSHGRARILD